MVQRFTVVGESRDNEVKLPAAASYVGIDLATEAERPFSFDRLRRYASKIFFLLVLHVQSGSMSDIF
jgi:hypothetical protein